MQLVQTDSRGKGRPSAHDKCPVSRDSECRLKNWKDDLQLMKRQVLTVEDCDKV